MMCRGRVPRRAIAQGFYSELARLLAKYSDVRLYCRGATTASVQMPSQFEETTLRGAGRARYFDVSEQHYLTSLAQHCGTNCSVAIRDLVLDGADKTGTAL